MFVLQKRYLTDVFARIKFIFSNRVMLLGDLEGIKV